MKNLIKKLTAASMAVIISTTSLSGCGELFFGYKQAREKVKEPTSYSFPLSEKETIHGMTSYPANTQSDPNKRDIFRRLEEQTNVHVDWKAIPHCLTSYSQLAFRIPICRDTETRGSSSRWRTI